MGGLAPENKQTKIIHGRKGNLTNLPDSGEKKPMRCKYLKRNLDAKVKELIGWIDFHDCAPRS